MIYIIEKEIEGKIVEINTIETTAKSKITVNTTKNKNKEGRRIDIEFDEQNRNSFEIENIEKTIINITIYEKEKMIRKYQF